MLSFIRIKSFALCLGLICLLGSCGLGNSVTRQSLWGKMYEERPASIVVMPPINKTQHVAAKEYFYSSLASPLAERGYYVYPPYLVLDVFQQESAADAEMFVEAPLKVFREVFATDAVLFTVINRWDKSLLDNSVRVEVEYILRSARTDQTIFRRSADMVVDTSVVSGWGLFDMVANAIATAATSKIVAARKANYSALYDMPFGKYAPEHNKDGKMPVPELNVKERRVR